MKKGAPVTIILECCTQCKEHTEMRAWTADSFETEFDWFCGIMKPKVAVKVRNNVEWNDQSKFIPEECPLRK